MTARRKALLYAAVAAPFGALALWAFDTTFLGGASARDWIVPVLIGLGIGTLAYFRPIQAARKPKPDA